MKRKHCNFRAPQKNSATTDEKKVHFCSNCKSAIKIAVLQIYRKDHTASLKLQQNTSLNDHDGTHFKYLSCIGILSISKRSVELANEQLVGPSQIVPNSEPQCHVGILQIRRNVVDDIVLINGHRQYLSFTVNTNNSMSLFIRSSNKNSLGADSIHVDANATFDIIKVDVTELGDQVDNAVFRTHLERKRDTQC